MKKRQVRTILLTIVGSVLLGGILLIFRLLQPQNTTSTNVPVQVTTPVIGVNTLQNDDVRLDGASSSTRIQSAQVASASVVNGPSNTQSEQSVQVQGAPAFGGGTNGNVQTQSNTISNNGLGGIINDIFQTSSSSILGDGPATTIIPTPTIRPTITPIPTATPEPSPTDTGPGVTPPDSGTQGDNG